MDDFYGVVKKGEEPKVTIQEDQILLANQKEQLTEDMPKVSLIYKKLETEEKSLPETSQPSQLDQVKNYLVPVILFVLGLVFLLIPIKKRKATGRTRSSSRSNGPILVKVIGVVCVLAALVLLLKEIV